MKNLLGPTLAVILSTSGCYFGCKAMGMPAADLKIAAILSFSVSATVAFGACALSALKQRRLPDHKA